MLLEIITPDKKVYSGNINLVKVPGTNGSFEILNNHAPIISTLDQGEVKVVDENNTELFFNITGGVIEVKDNHVIILADKTL